jgi:HlyD family secretion protein
MARIRQSLTITTLVLGCLASGGCAQQPVGAAVPAKGAEQDATAVDATVVKVVTATRGATLHATTQPATVRPNHVAHLFAKTAGYLEELHVDIGSRVEKGALLAKLSVPEVEKQHARQQAMVLKLKANAKRAAAEIDVAQAQVLSAEALLAQAGAGVNASQAQVAADTAELMRVTSLVENKSVASRLLDEAQKRSDSSKAAQLAAEAALKSAEAGVVVAKAKLAAAEADLETAHAETAVAERQAEELAAWLDYAEIKAPFAGVITERNVDVGDLVTNASTSGNSKPLLVLVDTARVRVQVVIPERDAPWASVGDEATIRFPALAGREFTGPVARVASFLDDATRSMLVEIDLDNEQQTLLPGMFGEAKVTLEQQADGIYLPASAVRFDTKGVASVYVVSAGKVQTVPVTIGSDDGQKIEISSGLSGGEQVVDAMLGRLTDGQQVRIQP